MTAREEPQTQSLELAREELAAVLAEHLWADPVEEGFGYQVGWSCRCGLETVDEGDLEQGEKWHTCHLADALLTSPALVRAIREREESAWDEGRRDTRAGWLDPTHYVFNPYRNLTEETP